MNLSRSWSISHDVPSSAYCFHSTCWVAMITQLVPSSSTILIVSSSHPSISGHLELGAGSHLNFTSLIRAKYTENIDNQQRSAHIPIFWRYHFTEEKNYYWCWFANLDARSNTSNTIIHCIITMLRASIKVQIQQHNHNNNMLQCYIVPHCSTHSYTIDIMLKQNYYCCNHKATAIHQNSSSRKPLQ